MFHFIKTAKLSYEVVVSFCLPTNTESSYCSTSTFSPAFGVVSVPNYGQILVDVWWYVILICISQMTIDVEQLFICLFFICIPLLGCVLRSLVYFKNQVVCFLPDF